MPDERFGVETQMLGIASHHLERLQALRQARQIALLDRLEMIGMNAGGFARRLDRLAALFPFALKIPPRLAGRIELAVGSQPIKGGPALVAVDVLDRIAVRNAHAGTL